MMNRIFLTALTCAALSFGGFSQAAVAEHSEHGHAHHGMDAGKMAEEMAKSCEERLAKVKDTGASLPADLKGEFDYYLEIVGIELKALKDPNHQNHKRHGRACQRRLKKAEHVVKKHERRAEHEKKKEERKAKAEARKAHKEALKAEKAADHHAHKNLDHGQIDEPAKGAAESKK